MLARVRVGPDAYGRAWAGPEGAGTGELGGIPGLLWFHCPGG